MNLIPHPLNPRYLMCPECSAYGRTADRMLHDSRCMYAPSEAALHRRQAATRISAAIRAERE
ncbi:hypothetical protein [Deinococcus xinjiangensis]|uniref:hypothetical protein n=1 Tax=Deinococcus xinjiangensis TaxID=457454 RepID=UPI003365A0AC